MFARVTENTADDDLVLGGNGQLVELSQFRHDVFAAGRRRNVCTCHTVLHTDTHTHTRTRTRTHTPVRLAAHCAGAPTITSDFWATLCRTVRPTLSVRCLSVCLSETLVYCGQTAGRIKMKLGKAGRPRPRPHCVRWGPSSPSPKGAQPTNSRPISVVAKWLDGSRCHSVGC